VRCSADDPGQRRVGLRDLFLAGRARAGDGAQVDDAEDALRQQPPRVGRQRGLVLVDAAERPGGGDGGTGAHGDRAAHRLGERARRGAVRQVVLVVAHDLALIGEVGADGVGPGQPRRERRARAGDPGGVPRGVVAGAEREPAVGRAGGVVRGLHRQPADRALGRLRPQCWRALRVEVVPTQPRGAGDDDVVGGDLRRAGGRAHRQSGQARRGRQQHEQVRHPRPDPAAGGAGAPYPPDPVQRAAGPTGHPRLACVRAVTAAYAARTSATVSSSVGHWAALRGPRAA
jgi:hypothetical protein